MDYKLEEVYARILTHSRLLGTTFQSRTSHSLSSGLILRFLHQCPIPSVNVNSHACLQDILHHQSDLALCSLYPSRAPPSQVPTVLDKKTVVTAPTVMGHPDITGCGISCSSQLIQHLPELSLFFMDASLTVWGASWHHLQFSGQWSNQESSQHINWLELEAIRLTLLQWGTQWRNQTVWVYCDNSMAVAYIHKQGATHSISLFNKTLELFHLLDQYVILPIPSHLPGARNATADALSRINSPSPTEWRIPQETLSNLFSVLGTTLVDMFAMAKNNVTPVFVSPYPDNRVWEVDALSI